MIIANTWFPIHPRRRWTWSSPGDRSRNQIDFILVKQRFRNSVQYAKAMPGADCGSDHNPVVCQIKLKLKALKKAKRSTRYQFEALKKDEIGERYNVLVKKKFETLVAVTTAEEKWNQLKDCIQEGIEEQVSRKARKEHKKWITTKILDLMEKRRQAKHFPDRYKELNKSIKQKCTEAKKEWLNQKCDTIDQKHITKITKEMFQEKNEIAGKRKSGPASSCIKDKDGKMSIEKNEVLNRWAEYSSWCCTNCLSQT
ncbi:endonuclease-reverse transcriptase [Elysia marginata]|uniref:Endonuclease-reverse transcriptase n=1 Tax=Elysia marginata TaxID=1093978 RepID=A0AAV4H6I3_9GAST|nr:endonuclease-reverse transcriptase [Elysia marginata]